MLKTKASIGNVTENVVRAEFCLCKLTKKRREHPGVAERCRELRREAPTNSRKAEASQTATADLSHQHAARIGSLAPHDADRCRRGPLKGLLRKLDDLLNAETLSNRRP